MQPEYFRTYAVTKAQLPRATCDFTSHALELIYLHPANPPFLAIIQPRQGFVNGPSTLPQSEDLTRSHLLFLHFFAGILLFLFR